MTLRGLTPSAGLGVSASDERWVARMFRDTTRALLLADDQRRYVAGNKAACHLLGISPDELPRKRIDDFLPAAARPGIDEVWEEFLAVGTQHAPITLARADGTQITVQFTAMAHFLPGLHLSIMQSIQTRQLASIQDPARLTALFKTGLLDSAPEEAYDRVTRLVARELGVPTALISLVDHDRQFFKSQVGLSPSRAEQRETPLSHSFCQHTVATDAPIIVPDAQKDPRFFDNPAVDDDNVRAYLGVPIRTADGHVLGSLCAIDSQPHSWTGEQIELLLELGELLSVQIQDTASTPARLV